MRVETADQYRDDEYEQDDQRTRSAPARQGRNQTTYSRRRKRATHYAGMHRRRARRWNW